MSRWWRAYDEAVDDPKLQRLGPALGWAWFNLMCIASKNNGILPAIGDVAFKLRTSEQKAAATIAALVSAGLLERRDDGCFEPHNWHARQFRSDVSTERVKRFRNAKRNVSADVSETPPETETETEQNRIDSSSLRSDAAPSAATGPTRADLEKQFYDRGKQVCGKNAGGMLTALLKSREFDIALARGVLETAATKQDPREYVAAAIKGGTGPPSRNGFVPRPGSKDDTRERTVNALRKLTDYVEAQADDEGRGGRANPPDVGGLPLLEPP